MIYIQESVGSQVVDSDGTCCTFLAVATAGRKWT